jgi:hypothetical protein
MIVSSRSADRSSASSRRPIIASAYEIAAR